MDDFRQEWFSKHLAAAGEAPLVAGVGTKRVGQPIRFVWLPTFDNPVIVRIGGGPDHRLVAIRLSGAGGYEPGVVADRIDRPLTANEWTEIKQMLNRTEIMRQRSTDCKLGCDGSEWIVEAIDDDGYHFLRRWTPQDGPVREFGQAMVRLTGWKFDEIY